MHLRRINTLLFASLLALGIASTANAAITIAPESSTPPTPFRTQPEAPVAGDSIDARQYQLSNVRIPGQTSARQSVTAWQVSQGSWQGQCLDGMTLVLVRTSSEDGRQTSTTNCYVSHFATPAQRAALLDAFNASQNTPSDKPALWRVEPAVIRLEFLGRTVVLHVGTIA